MDLPAKSRVLGILMVSIGFVLIFAHDCPAAGLRLRIGVLPEMNVFTQMKRFVPLARHLTETTGIDVRVTLLSLYGNLAKRFRTKKLDGAFLGSYTGMVGYKELDLVSLARPVNLDGESTYFGHVLVRKGSGIQVVKDMRGKRLALVSRATTAGFVYPIVVLRRQGVTDPASFFQEIVYTGSHDAAIEALLSGRVDVAAAKNTIFDRMKRKRPTLGNTLRSIYRSPRVPSNGLFLKKSLPPSALNALKVALLSLHEKPEGRAVLKVFGARRFVVTTRKDYQIVFDLVKEAEAGGSGKGNLR